VKGGGRSNKEIGRRGDWDGRGSMGDREGKNNKKMYESYQGERSSKI